MNDNRMDPSERNKYWTRNIAVPGGAVGYMTMADPRFMLLAFVIFICGMLQFVYSERPTYIRISMPVFVIMLAVAGISALFDQLFSALFTGAMLFWRCYDFRRVNNSRTILDLLRDDRGQVYATIIALYIVGFALTMIKLYIPLHNG